MLTKFKTPFRFLLGGIYFIFGLNFFLNFLPMPPPSPNAGAFLGALMQSGYLLQVVKTLEVSVGLLLLTNLFVPLALVLIAPISLNILFIHTFIDPAGLPVALVVVLLNAFLGIAYLECYRPMLKMRVK